jgi:hypothetical protein
MQRVRWWQFGLIGGFALSVATLIKFVRAVARGLGGQAELGEAVEVAVAVFAMGFLCGVIVWAGRGLYPLFGMAGDAIVGVAVMVFFFLCCMVLFDPELLGAKFSVGGAPMLGLAVVIGLICGPWFGRDLRKEFADEDSRTHRSEPESRTEHDSLEAERRARDGDFGP